MTFAKYNVEEALQNPQEVFTSPEQVASDPRLDRTTKVAILRKWLEISDCAPSNAQDKDRQEAGTLGRRLEESIARLSRAGRTKRSRSSF